MKKVMLAAFILLPLSQAMALDCQNAQTQTDMNMCASTDYKKADSALNQTYMQVLKKTSGQQKALFQEAQRKWIAYRDADCKYQSFASQGGSAHALSVAGCLQSKTEQRTRELKEMLTCPEGDISCPR